MSERTSTMARTDDAPRNSDVGPGLILIFSGETPSTSRGIVLDEQRSCIVGREPAPGRWSLPQTAISRTHALVQKHGDGSVTVKDLGSRNGTFVDGERIEERTLQHGDDVRIGDAIFVFVESEAREHVRYRLDGSIERGAEPIDLQGVAGGWSMARLAKEVRAVAPSDGTVLLLGETGVGKELVARGVHDASRRRGPFVAVNSAALAPNLVESTMFGHERGAFTGAEKSREGLVRSAHGGTLFLDEIGELGLDAQAKLLRTLESREVLAVGATHAVNVDVRFVCATHRDLGRLVAEGKFRADLYARIKAHTLAIPPLRRRKEDLPLLVRDLLQRFGGANDRPVPKPSLAFMLRLVRHDWPMNVRELANVLQHAVRVADEAELRSVHLPPDFAEPLAPESSVKGADKKRDKIVDRERLLALMKDHEGNVSAVARVLKKDAAQIYRWLKKHDIDPTRYR